MHIGDFLEKRAGNQWFVIDSGELCAAKLENSYRIDKNIIFNLKL